MSGYYRYPTVHDSKVVFVSEDDLWQVPLEGGMASRLTSALGTISNPCFSPDGKWLAFSSSEEGYKEIYVMPAQGGSLKRLTYLGGQNSATGWLDNKTIVFRSDAFMPSRMTGLATVSITGELATPMKLGPAANMAINQAGQVVVERNANRFDAAWWKRYRGGTAGQFFIADSINSEFIPFLKKLKGNLSRPLWIEDRIFFLSDHEGIANIYSVKPDESDLRAHSNMKEYYARNIATDGKNIVFHAGSDLYRINLANNQCDKMAVTYESQRVQKQRKFIDPSQYLETFKMSHDGNNMALTARGQVTSMGHWFGPAKVAGQKTGVRYRLGRWLQGDEKLIMVSDEGGEEHLVIYDTHTHHLKSYPQTQWGRFIQIKVAPKNNLIAFSNHKNEVHVYDLEKEKAILVAKNEHRVMEDFSWSPDGRYLAYSRSTSLNSSQIEIFDTKAGKSFAVTKPMFQDFSPSFDPEGKYLYFLMDRDLNPVYDAIQFDLSFPQTTLLGLVTLRQDVTSPFMPPPIPPKKVEESAKDEKKEVAIEIDFDGIADRMLSFPIPAAKHTKLVALKNKVLYSTYPVEGARDLNWLDSQPPTKQTLNCFDFSTMKSETWIDGITTFDVSENGERIAVQIGFKMRVLKASEKPARAAATDYNEKTGWVDLSRMKVFIEPEGEWKQMLNEVWRLQREHFWREDMSKIDWKNILKRYQPLVARVSTRSEFGDLVWELQGELGTSHAYDMGGDYRKEPLFSLGLLGGHFQWDDAASGYRITRIIQGDSWNGNTASPLKTPGLDAQIGDWLLAINGQTLTKEKQPGHLLLGLAGQETELTIKSFKDGQTKSVTVKPLKTDMGSRYREWVEHNRKYVHEKSNGQLGYVHVPDMSAVGFSEFHRYYLQEYDRDGLVIDVRFNGGGHVSQLLLEKLARKRLGFDESRWFGRMPYPGESPAGPIVALTNEFAGSDGDIFSHSFKLMKLGPLLGKRTWGGVIGIWPRHSLVDGGITTQPEFSFWFNDVGWDVENYGAVPDIEVENFPHHYRRDQDAQLDAGIAEALKLMKSTPAYRPKVDQYPDLSF